MIKFYQTLSVISYPLLRSFLAWRTWRGKENKARLPERLGIPSIAKPEKQKVIWFHATSVGESNVAFSFIETLMKFISDDHVLFLITTTTITSANSLAKKIGQHKNIIHQFVPIDSYFVIRRFLRYWQPKIFVMIESEIWPNMISLSHNMGLKVILLNGKMSDKSFKFWRKIRNVFPIFPKIDLCYAQSKKDYERFSFLRIPEVKYLGNLKLAIKPLKINDKLLASLKEGLGNRPFVLFASIHFEEMEEVYKTMEFIKREISDCVFLMAIRHPEKSLDFFNFFTQHNYIVHRKSQKEIANNQTSLYIYDEIGEMGTFFTLSPICIMGGSFVDGIGGHTPIEPAKHHTAIITGPYIFNNANLFSILEQNGAAIAITNKDNVPKHIAYKVAHLIHSPKERETLAQNAFNLCQGFENDLQKTAKEIADFID